MIHSYCTKFAESMRMHYLYINTLYLPVYTVSFIIIQQLLAEKERYVAELQQQLTGIQTENTELKLSFVKVEGKHEQCCFCLDVKDMTKLLR